MDVGHQTLLGRKEKHFFKKKHTKQNKTTQLGRKKIRLEPRNTNQNVLEVNWCHCLTGLTD